MPDVGSVEATSEFRPSLLETTRRGRLPLRGMISNGASSRSDGIGLRRRSRIIRTQLLLVSWITDLR